MRFFHVDRREYHVTAERAERRENVVWDRDAGYGSTIVMPGEWIVHTPGGPVLAVRDRTFRRFYRPLRRSA